MKTTKALIYAVSAAIVALLATDTYLFLTGKATLSTIAELCVGAAALLAATVVLLVKAVRALSARMSRKSRAEELADRVASMDDTLSSVESKVDGVADSVEAIGNTLDERLGPEPDVFTPVILGTDACGKRVEWYRLPDEETWDAAADAARESIRARRAEGDPVPDATWKVIPSYRP